MAKPLPKDLSQAQPGAAVGTMSRDPYSMMMFTQMDPSQRAAWFQATGQQAQAQAWQKVALGTAGVNAGLGALQLGMAYAIESAPGVAPPPYTGGPIWWSSRQRVAREEELTAPGRAMAAEARRRREAATAASDVRTSAGQQERAARAEQEAFRGYQEAARAQRSKEEAAEAAQKSAEKYAARQARFAYDVQERERQRQAKMNLLSGAFRVGGELLSSVAPSIAGAVAQGAQTKAAAAQYGMTPKEYKTAIRAPGQYAATGQKLLGVEREIAERGKAGKDVSERLSTKHHNLFQKQREIAQGAVAVGAHEEWFPGYATEPPTPPIAPVASNPPFLSKPPQFDVNDQILSQNIYGGSVPVWSPYHIPGSVK
tara:strand:+ start:303 stop:1412 length:1110 start_codon:yes stop_codon:yes gene_type:complete